MGKTKTKKFRGSGRHGRGRKGGRGKGLRGGSGNAGLHKHKYASTVIKEAQGIQMFGHVGFKRPFGTVFADATLNVSDLTQRFTGQKEVDLGAHGYTKLLGAGTITVPMTVHVEAASAGAVQKVKAAGGNVVTTRPKHVPKPPKAAAAPGKPEAKPASAPKPAAAKPEGKPAGGKPPSAPPKA